MLRPDTSMAMAATLMALDNELDIIYLLYSSSLFEFFDLNV